MPTSDEETPVTPIPDPGGTDPGPALPDPPEDEPPGVGDDYSDEPPPPPLAPGE